MSPRRFYLWLALTGLLSGLVSWVALPTLAYRGLLQPADPSRSPTYLAALPCLHYNLLDAPMPETQPALPKVEPWDFGPDVVVLVTGQNDGQLEICNCSEGMEGGLSRRMSVVQAYRQAWPQALLVDVGDVSAVKADGLADGFIRQGYALLRYDAVAIGDQDLDAWGAQPTAVLEQLPWLSSNLELAGVGRPKDQVTLTRAGRAITITSTITPAAVQFLEPSVRSRATVHPPKPPAGLEGLRIGLLHRDESEEVSEELCQGLDLVIVSPAGEKPLEPRQIGRTWLVAPPTTGRGLGVVALKLSPVGRIEQLRWRVVRIQAAQWPRDPVGWELYQAYSLTARKTQLAAPSAAGLPYQSSYQCGRCHQAQYQHWQTTAHAHAYATLVAVQRQEDPNCLACHTSGSGTAAGFVGPQATPHLANVNCMDCHPIDPDQHLRNPRQALAPVGQATCRRCHNQTASPQFEYEQAVKKVDHAH